MCRQNALLLKRFWWGLNLCGGRKQKTGAANQLCLVESSGECSKLQPQELKKAFPLKTASKRDLKVGTELGEPAVLRQALPEFGGINSEGPVTLESPA